MRKMTLPVLTTTVDRNQRGRAMRAVAIAFCALMMFACWACDNSRVYEKNKEIGEEGWRSAEVMKFNVDIPDAATLYNFYINIRITGDYKYANMFLFMRTLYPGGKMSTDTVECYFADVDGRWLGKRSGSMIDNRILLRKNLKFTETGTYSFEFEQAMRDTVLEQVSDFGIRIEKAEQ